MLGPAGLEISSSHGNLSLASHGHLRLQSNTGQVSKTMKIIIKHHHNHPYHHHHHHHRQIELVSQRVLLRDVPVANVSSSALGPQPTIHQVIIIIIITYIFIVIIIVITMLSSYIWRCVSARLATFSSLPPRDLASPDLKSATRTKSCQLSQWLQLLRWLQLASPDLKSATRINFCQLEIEVGMANNHLSLWLVEKNTADCHQGQSRRHEPRNYPDA